MKKILLFLMAIVPLLSAAQVQITEQEKNYEFIGRSVLYWKHLHEYSLYIASDNPYEDKYVDIPIGKTAQEAYESLKNIYQLYQRVDRKFVIGGRDVHVDNACCIRVIKNGDLYYTAGQYYLLSHNLLGSMNRLKNRAKQEAKAASRTK